MYAAFRYLSYFVPVITAALDAFGSAEKSGRAKRVLMRKWAEVSADIMLQTIDRILDEAEQQEEEDEAQLIEQDTRESLRRRNLL